MMELFLAHGFSLVDLNRKARRGRFGVYALLNRGRVVYVGSGDIEGRIKSHCRERTKKFDCAVELETAAAKTKHPICIRWIRIFHPAIGAIALASNGEVVAGEPFYRIGCI